MENQHTPICVVGPMDSPECHSCPWRAAEILCISHQQAEGVFFVLSATWNAQLYAPARPQPTRQRRQRRVREVKATRSMAGCLTLLQLASERFGQSCSESYHHFPGGPLNTPDDATDGQIWGTKCETGSGRRVL